MWTDLLWFIQDGSSGLLFVFIHMLKLFDFALSFCNVENWYCYIILENNVYNT